jgi:hypothetical protein
MSDVTTIALTSDIRRPPSAIEEYALCSTQRGFEGFQRWCSRYAKVLDKANKRPVPLIFFPGQGRIAALMASGESLIALKARQLGLTWLCVAYALWRLIYTRYFSVMVLAQERGYAQDFKRRFLWMHDQLPTSMRLTPTKNNEEQVRFEARGHNGELRCLAGSGKAARSVSGDLIIIDEAARCPALGDCVVAIRPALEVASGQLFVISTSDGPHGDFFDLWRATYGSFGELLDPNTGRGPTLLVPTFLGWAERAGRDDVWFQTRCAELDAVSPILRKREYPESEADAWEFAAGRIYPLFTSQRCIGDVPLYQETIRYRAIDWGQGESAQVCLWLAVFPGPSALLVSPKCPNTIRELLGYRWDPDRPDEPLKKQDHACDALRYAVTRWNLQGLVYVYRESYRVDSAIKGWDPIMEIAEVHAMSGWRQAVAGDNAKPGTWVPAEGGEIYQGTVADRSWPKMIQLYRVNGIPTIGSAVLRSHGPDGVKDKPEKERLEGIRLVSQLIAGSKSLDHRPELVRMPSLGVDAGVDPGAESAKRRDRDRMRRAARLLRDVAARPL